MHSAPSVTYPVRRSAQVRILLLAFWALGVSSVGAWCHYVDSLSARQMVGLAALCLTTFLVWRDVTHVPGGDVHWDGQYWSLHGVSPLRTAQATVHLDFQSWLLLRLKVDRSVSWVWLARQASPERWHDVRRALFASPTSADKTTDDSAPSSSKHPAATVR